MPRVSPAQVEPLWQVNHRPLRSPLQVAEAAFNWCLWLFIKFLMLSQLITAIRNSTSSEIHTLIGQDVSRGLYSIPGDNDEPYSDRLVTCVRRGRTFKTMSLNDGLNSGSTIEEDSTGSAVHGYRVVLRTGHELTETTK